MCKATVTYVELSEDNSISAVKVGQTAMAEKGLDGMQFFGRTSVERVV